MEENQAQNSLKRNVTGFIFGVVALLCIVFGGMPLLFLLLTVILLGSKEYVQILRVKGFHPSFSVIGVVGVLICLVLAIGQIDLIPAVLVLGTIASFLIVLFMGRQPYIANVATTELGFLYAALLPAHIMLIRQIDFDITKNIFIYDISDGFYLTTMTFFCVLVTDTAAYFGGKYCGKHKLSNVISPKKTVEGAVIGAVCAILISLPWSFCTELSMLECAIGGLIITAASQLGDLSESLIKRDAGVKDSSNLLPGHGGFLDRCDSYIFALPAAYYYFACFTGGNNFFLDLFNYMKSILHVAI